MNKFIYSAVIIPIVLNVDAALAQSVYKTIDQVSEQTTAIPTFLTTVAYIMGIVATISGLLKLKDYVDDPGRSTFKDAIIRFIIAGLLISLPFTASVVIGTLGENSAESGSAIAKRDLSLFGDGK